MWEIKFSITKTNWKWNHYLRHTLSSLLWDCHFVLQKKLSIKAAHIHKATITYIIVYKLFYFYGWSCHIFYLIIYSCCWLCYRLDNTNKCYLQITKPMFTIFKCSLGYSSTAIYMFQLFNQSLDIFSIHCLVRYVINPLQHGWKLPKLENLKTMQGPRKLLHLSCFGRPMIPMIHFQTAQTHVVNCK